MHRSRYAALGGLLLFACSPSPALEEPAASAGMGGTAGTAVTTAGGGNGGGGASGSGGSNGGTTPGGSAGLGGSSGAGGSAPQANFTAQPTTFKGGAKGAYTIIHDDLCGSPGSLVSGSVSGLLAARGLHAAFGAIVKDCIDAEHWPAVNTLAGAGHEIINHSWDHTDHVCAANYPVQIDQAHTSLGENVATPSFYIFPFDSSNDAALDHLKTLGYLGARGGVKGALTPGDWADDFKLNFDVYGPGYSFYCDLGACGGETLVCRKGYAEVACVDGGPDGTNQGDDACRASILQQYVDDAMAQGGWAIREFHGVDDGWEPVPTAIYSAHLDYVAAKASAGELWVENPTPIIKYRRAREYCAATVSDWTLSFGTPSADCVKYAVPVTYEITLQTPATTLTATQAGTALTVTSKGAGSFLVEIDPTQGDVLFSAP
ncbi:MAG TPA: polysaccharide deacetylase family protein [Polyangiaceae bacterium]|nr:polysaccharide deacetylase family protein [Polyangiaceae bacterium]